MTAITEKLHRAFLRPLGDAVLRHSPAGDKPLSVDLALPNPPRLRVYMYTLVGGVGTVRPNEYKAVLRVPGQAVGAYDSFDHSDGRLALVVGYRADLDVFVFWDAKRTVDSVAAAHVAELRARTEAFYVGALSFESFGVKQREHWDRIRGARPLGAKPGKIEARVMELLRDRGSR